MKYAVLFLGLGLTVQAQQAITTTGGNASGSGGTVAYSVGQNAYAAKTEPPVRYLKAYRNLLKYRS